MVILSSEEFKAQESQRQYMGKQGLTQEINLQSSLAFGHTGTPNPSVEYALNNNSYIAYLLVNDRVAASAFGKFDGTDSKYKTMNINSISVSVEFRGQGLCKQICDEFVKEFGKHILYLTVRTQAGNENISGIKCYEKNGFIMLNEVYRDHYDGKNTAMIRLPTQKRSSNTKRKTKRHKKKRR
jgi:ribosomal protein S18 acetylase RimI-like enzyme